MQAEAARREAETASPARQREEVGKAGAQTAAHAIAIAVHGFIDAGTEGRHAREPRLPGERYPDGKPHGAVDRDFGPAARIVYHPRTHVLAGGGARTRPGVRHLPRAAGPHDVARRSQAGGVVGADDAGFRSSMIARRAGAA